MRSPGLLRSPAVAIVWEIWHRNRGGAMVLGFVLLSAGTINWTLLRNSPWSDVAKIAGYILLVAALVATFGFFHFTEGRRKGGFGSFPQRLFNMPIATPWLVAIPMIYGAVVILAVYLASAWLVFRPLDVVLPVVWPSLYLVAGLAIFQMIVWSIPERRYLKILCLSLAATVICFGWMFFLPHVTEGTLSELGYKGSPRSFQAGLMIALFLTAPAAYGISLWRVGQQRHGGGVRAGGLAVFSEVPANRFLLRTRPFPSACHAVFWYEWRRTGFILPIAVGVVLAMTCIPAWLSGPISENATLGLLSWIYLSPIVLSAIVGCGFAKFDFWNPELKMTHFAAVRPFSAGQWVMIKLHATLASAAATWALVLLVSFLWVVHVGDFGGLDQIYRQLGMYYSHLERWLLAVIALFGALLLTWRFLVSGLAIGLSAHKGWFYAANSLRALALATLLFLMIWRDGRIDHPFHLYDLWPWMLRLPVLLAGAVIAKALFSAWAWVRVRRLRMISPKSVAAYFGVWTLATGVLAAGMSIAFPHTPWLRHSLILLSLLIIPLAGPPLAMLAFSRNRSQP